MNIVINKTLFCNIISDLNSYIALKDRLIELQKEKIKEEVESLTLNIKNTNYNEDRIIEIKKEIAHLNSINDIENSRLGYTNDRLNSLNAELIYLNIEMKSHAGFQISYIIPFVNLITHNYHAKEYLILYDKKQSLIKNIDEQRELRNKFQNSVNENLIKITKQESDLKALKETTIIKCDQKTKQSGMKKTKNENKKLKLELFKTKAKLIIDGCDNVLLLLDIDQEIASDHAYKTIDQVKEFYILYKLKLTLFN